MRFRPKLLIIHAANLLLATNLLFNSSPALAEDDVSADLQRQIQALRQAVDQQTRQIELLVQEMERLNAALQHETASSGAPRATPQPDPLPDAIPSPPDDEGPATAAPASPETYEAGREEAVIHVVQPGETLTAIARRYDISVEDLRRYNRVQDDRRLQVGHELVIPDLNQPHNEEEP